MLRLTTSAFIILKALNKSGKRLGQKSGRLIAQFAAALNLPRNCWEDFALSLARAWFFKPVTARTRQRYLNAIHAEINVDDRSSTCDSIAETASSTYDSDISAQTPSSTLLPLRLAPVRSSTLFTFRAPQQEATTATANSGATPVKTSLSEKQAVQNSLGGKLRVSTPINIYTGTIGNHDDYFCSPVLSMPLDTQVSPSLSLQSIPNEASDYFRSSCKRKYNDERDNSVPIVGKKKTRTVCMETAESDLVILGSMKARRAF